MIALCFGTRPEIIKMSPVIRELISRGISHYTVHSGQHYSPNMSGNFFDELEIPQPSINLEVGNASHPATQLANIIYSATAILADRYSLVIVHGDTNTALGCALAANKVGIPVAHVEAGLRCQDRDMPEEMNRRIIDRIAEYGFPPTSTNLKTLRRECVTLSEDDHMSDPTGNTVIDAMVHAGILPVKREPDSTILLTLHRQENVDDPVKLRAILDAVEKTSLGNTVIFPCHPRTRKNLRTDYPNIRIVPPMGYREFLERERDASLIITDSGGVVEEACALQTPCVILRDYTERPEAITCGAATLANAETLPDAAHKMLHSPRTWENPFGDGKAAVKIVDYLEKWGLV